MRKYLQDGFLRTILTWMAGGISLFVTVILMVIYEESIANHISDFFTSIRLFGLIAALIAALLSGITYNLRSKSIDYFLKYYEKGYITHNVKETGEKLTNLTLLSFITLNILLVSSCMPQAWISALYISIPISCAFIAACSVQYIYAVFAQEKLELFVLEAAEKTYKNLQKS